MRIIGVHKVSSCGSYQGTHFVTTNSCYLFVNSLFMFGNFNITKGDKQKKVKEILKPILINE